MADDEIQELLQKRRYAEALERLLDRYEAKVFRMAFVILKDRGRAEEVTQDVFLKLWRALPGYDARAAPGTWLYAIARNTCLAAQRSESYRAATPLDHIPEPAASAAGPPLELSQYINRLPEVQRQVIALFYMEGRCVEEVSQALGMPVGTVKSHLHRARAALAVMMEDKHHAL